MENKKIPTHFIFMGVELVLAVLTLIPMASAGKVSLLGYKSLCSFAPISTLLLLAAVGFHYYLHRRAMAKKETRE